MLAMGLAYQVQSHSLRGGEDSGPRGCLDAAFDGCILVAEGVNAAGLSRDKQQMPHITVIDPVANQLYGPQRGRNRASPGSPVCHTADLRGSDPDSAPPGEIQLTNITTDNVRADYIRTDNVRTDRLEVPSSGSVARERETRESVSRGKERQRIQDERVRVAPMSQPARAAPVAWIVETESKSEKERDSARAAEVRLSKSKPSLSFHTVGAAGSDFGRRDGHVVGANPPQPSSSSSPSIGVGRHSEGSAVDRPSHPSHAPPTSFGGCYENRRDPATHDVMKRVKGGDMQATVVLQADCPLRCVRVLRDGSDSRNSRDKFPSSSSLTFAVGSNDKSVKVARIALDSSVSVVREFSEAHRGSIYAMDWSTEGAQGGHGGLLATASNDKTVRILK